MDKIAPGEEALNLLRVMSDAMAQKLSADETLTRVFQNLCQIMDVEAGFLLLLDQREKSLAIKKSLRLGEKHLEKFILQLDRGLVKSCVETGETMMAQKVTSLTQFDPVMDSVAGIEPRTFLCVPIYHNQSYQGAIVLLNKQDGYFDHIDQTLLSSLGTIFAHLLYASNLVQELQVANADLEANRWEITRSRNTLRALFDNIPLSFYIIDRDFNLLAVNISRCARLHLEPPELVGKKCYAALFRRTSPCPACKVYETFQDGEITTRIGYNWKPDGYSEEWDIRTYPAYDETGDVIQVILSEENITEKRQLEYKLIQSEKLAVVGQLAAGIAHEINNPLTAVIANVQLIQRELPRDHEIQESLDLIALAGERAAQVVRNLLDLTRKENYKFVPTNINVTIQKALELLQHELISHSINLTYHAGEGLPELLASPEHLEGVWINILANAFDVVEHQGKGEITITSRQQDHQVHVMIADNGQGIPPERISRLFDPFYTTKAAGHGTGLGLTISQRIIKQHGGYIMVDSQLNKGTQFTIVLPVK